MRKKGIRLSRRAGQHLLMDPTILERMVGYAEVSREDVVLEIGTGVGTLTSLLADQAKRVISIERDERLLEVAREVLGDRTNVILMRGDATEVELPTFNKAVANIPYVISSAITFRLLERGFDTAVLMYQREFANRMVALPASEDYGRLTVNVRYRADAEVLEEVPPEAFHPPPKVSSSIVRLTHHKPPFEVSDEEKFFTVVRALFQHRRQRVRNSLLRSFDLVFPGKELPKAERRKFIDRKLPSKTLESRVMDLPPEKFGEISDILFSP